MKLSHIAKSTLIIAFFFALDKGLGLLRARFFNLQFGPAQRDVFFISNNIPDLLSALISGGAMGMALIPVLTEVLDQEGRQAAWALFNRILNLAFIATAAVAVVIILLAQPLVQYVIAPGFNDPEKWALTVHLMRLDLGAILIFSISGLAMAGLQTHQHFVLPAMAPVLYNLGQILGIKFLGPQLGISGMVYGVILGAALHLAIQIPGLLYYGWRWAPKLALNEPRVRQVLHVLVPRILNMACIQSYFVFRDRFASYLETGAVSALNNGWFIMQVPETLIGSAIAIALLPTLADQLARGQQAAFKSSINAALRALLALTLPITAILAITIRPLAHAAFGFEGRELELVTWTTRAFLIGLVGQTWLEVGVRSFYARQIAWLPLAAAAVQAAAFWVTAQVLSTWLGAVGIALADTLTFSAQAFVLIWLLNRAFPGIASVGSTLVRGALAAGLGAALAFGLVTWLPIGALPASLAAAAAGGLAALPIIWPEVRLLLKLGTE